MAIARREFVSHRSSSRMSVSVKDSARWSRNQNLVKFTPAKSMGVVSSSVMIVAFIATLGLTYLTQLTKTGSFGYELDTINRKKTELAAYQDNLKVENARLQSLNAVKNSAAAKQMTEPATTNYAE